MTDITQFDPWLTSDDFAALVIREYLEPVEGADGVLFPATYAAAENKNEFPGGYNIDPPNSKENVCLIDSVGSQANRIEPIFSTSEYSHLVPQIHVKAGEKSINLLDASHRAGDALVRCTPLQGRLNDAFKSVIKGDAEPLARIAPTSLVFGVWDSRNTQAKLPRLISSTIRAFNVRELRRSAQFNPATDYIGDGLLEDTSDKTTRDAYGKRGFIHVPATGTHGGVIADGGIRRDAILSLAALRLLAAAKDAKKTLALRRYILGLSLVALTTHVSSYLRQGCNLVPSEKPREFNLVLVTGKREPQSLDPTSALSYATAAAKEFRVDKGEEVTFDVNLAQQDIKGQSEQKAAKTKKAKA